MVGTPTFRSRDLVDGARSASPPSADVRLHLTLPTWGDSAPGMASVLFGPGHPGMAPVRGTRRVTRTAVRRGLSNEGHIKVRAWACRRTFASSSFRFTSLSRSGSCHHFVSW